MKFSTFDVKSNNYIALFVHRLFDTLHLQIQLTAKRFLMIYAHRFMIAYFHHHDVRQTNVSKDIAPTNLKCVFSAFIMLLHSGFIDRRNL